MWWNLSSRIFATNMLNSGITSFELRELSVIKVFGTDILENFPQLICQIMYIIILGGIPTSNTILAFIASILSVISVIISYYLYHRHSDDRIVIQYDLEMIVKHKNNTKLTKKEKKRIFLKKERKKSLKILLIPSLGITSSSLELGFITLNKKRLYYTLCTIYI